MKRKILLTFVFIALSIIAFGLIGASAENEKFVTEIADDVDLIEIYVPTVLKWEKNEHGVSQPATEFESIDLNQYISLSGELNWNIIDENNTGAVLEDGGILTISNKCKGGIITIRVSDGISATELNISLLRRETCCWGGVVNTKPMEVPLSGTSTQQCTVTIYDYYGDIVDPSLHNVNWFLSEEDDDWFAQYKTYNGITIDDTGLITLPAGTPSCRLWVKVFFHNGNGNGCGGIIVVTNSSSENNTNACGKNLSWNLDENGVLTISGTGEMYDFSENGQPWNEEKEKITEVVICDGVSSVGEYAFYAYPNIKTVRIPPSITTFAKNAFGEDFTNRRNVYITDLSKWCNIKFNHVYSNPLCSSYLYLNNELVEELVIPDDVKSIPSDAFSGCNSIKTVKVHKNITNDYDHWFYACRNLKSIIIDEDNPVYSSENGILFNKDKTILYQYSRGTDDEHYTVPKTVVEIGLQAFDGCRQLKEVVIPEGVVTINYYGFSGCRNLEKIFLPKSLKVIRGSSFKDCGKLTSVNYTGTESEWNSITIEQGNEPLTDARILYNYDPNNPSSVVKGDILQDGKVNAKDAVKLAQYLAKWDITLTDSEKLSADVVSDGVINAKDAVKLAQYLAKWDITLD